MEKNLESKRLNMIETYFRNREQSRFFYGAVGFIIYRTQGNILSIEDFFISPNHRSKGFGVQMLRSLIEEQENLSEVWCGIQDDLPNSSRTKLLIEKFGFKLSHYDSKRLYGHYTKYL